MTKRRLLQAFILLLTFIAGFLAGVFFSSNDERFLKISLVPNSEIHPEQKQLPDFKEKSSKVLIGYVQDFRDPNVVNYRNLTHVVFSFAHPTIDGHLLLNGKQAVKNLRTTVKLGHQHDTKVILAIGGWFHMKGGESYQFFKPAISTTSSRQTLINELVSMVKRENLDGIDIDFEHPRTNMDARKLTAFVKELSGRLRQLKKELSIAVNAKVHSVAGTEINNVVFEPKMFHYVDHVNIMAYDGQWDGQYNAANLSPYPYVENIVNYWSNLFQSYKIDKNKLVLGIPFYGQPENPNSKQVSYAAIVQKNPLYSHQDVVKMNGTVYHYNGKITVQKKTKLAIDHGFGGIMLWEAGHDTKGPHSLTATIDKFLKDEKLLVIDKSK